MRYIRTFTLLLAVLLVASTFIVPIESTEKPPEPNWVMVQHALDWMDKWEDENVVPAAKDVNDAYDALSGVASAYKDAIMGVGDVAFSGVSSSVQTSWIAMVMSLYNTTKEGAKAIAKTQKLKEAVEEGINRHTMELYYFDDLWNSHLRVQEDLVWSQMRTQMSDGSGQLTLSANTMMEVYYKVTFVADLYNQQVDIWNQYAYEYEPNQVKDRYYPTPPTYPTFGKFLCFGGCNYEHDTMDYARDTHQSTCGTAENVDAVFKRRRGNISDVRRELKKRTLAQGCGRPYYVCNLDHKAEHEEQICGQWVYQPGDYYGAPMNRSKCGIPFRRCLGHTYNHDPTVIGSNTHSVSPDSSSTPTTTIAPTQVDNSPDCDSCTGSCSACADITYPCGVHSGPPGNASGHGRIASCSETNGWGHSCNATHYMCEQTQTHTFPTFSCAYRPCSAQVSDPQEHRRTCPHDGAKYWSCNPMGVTHHKTRICTRVKKKWKWNEQQEQYVVVWEACNEEWAHCVWQTCRVIDSPGSIWHRE